MFHLRPLVVKLKSIFLQHDFAGYVVPVELGHVLAQGARVDVGLVAHGAHVGPLPGVRPHVALQGARVRPGHAARQALERLHTCAGQSRESDPELLQSQEPGSAQTGTTAVWENRAIL